MIEAKDFVQENLKLFFGFIYERQNVWFKKEVLKEQPPWTNDEVLKVWKFTNVYRELDRTTQYIKERIIGSGLPEKDIVFNLILFRYFTSINTFEKLGGCRMLKDINLHNMDQTLKQMVANNEKIYTGAFCTSSDSLGNYNSKAEKMFHLGIKKIYENFDNIFYRLTVNKNNPDRIMDILKEQYAIGDFIAYVMLSDLVYLPIFKHIEDNATWMNPQVGAKKGLDILVNKKLVKNEYEEALLFLQKNQHLYFKLFGLEFKKWEYKNLSCFNIEHSLCEFYKYYQCKVNGRKCKERYKPKDF